MTDIEQEGAGHVLGASDLLTGQEHLLEGESSVDMAGPLGESGQASDNTLAQGSEAAEQTNEAIGQAHEALRQAIGAPEQAVQASGQADENGEESCTDTPVKSKPMKAEEASETPEPTIEQASEALGQAQVPVEADEAPGQANEPPEEANEVLGQALGQANGGLQQAQANQALGQANEASEQAEEVLSQAIGGPGQAAEANENGESCPDTPVRSKPVKVDEGEDQATTPRPGSNTSIGVDPSSSSPSTPPNSKPRRRKNPVWHPLDPYTGPTCDIQEPSPNDDDEQLEPSRKPLEPYSDPVESGACRYPPPPTSKPPELPPWAKKRRRLILQKNSKTKVP